MSLAHTQSPEEAQRYPLQWRGYSHLRVDSIFLLKHPIRFDKNDVRKSASNIDTNSITSHFFLFICPIIITDKNIRTFFKDKIIKFIEPFAWQHG